MNPILRTKKPQNSAVSLSYGATDGTRTHESERLNRRSAGVFIPKIDLFYNNSSHKSSHEQIDFNQCITVLNDAVFY